MESVPTGSRRAVAPVLATLGRVQHSPHSHAVPWAPCPSPPMSVDGSFARAHFFFIACLSAQVLVESLFSFFKFWFATRIKTFLKFPKKTCDSFSPTKITGVMPLWIFNLIFKQRFSPICDGGGMVLESNPVRWDHVPETRALTKGRTFVTQALCFACVLADQRFGSQSSLDRVVCVIGVFLVKKFLFVSGYDSNRVFWFISEYAKLIFIF